jgi:transposase
MAKKKYRRYSPEFKRHALKRASEDGVTDKGVCEDLGISDRQLRRWRDQYRLLGDEAFPGRETPYRRLAWWLHANAEVVGH